MSNNKNEFKGSINKSKKTIKEVIRKVVGNKKSEFNESFQKDLKIVQAKVAELKAAISKF
jgi:hypothetical protein